MNERQEKELFYVKPILQSIGVEDVIPADRPDLRFTYHGKTIGAEVVMCFPDSDSGRYEQMANRVYMACKEYAVKLKHDGIKGIRVTISFTAQAYTFEQGVNNKRFFDCVLSEIEVKRRQQEYEASLSSREAIVDYYQMMAKGVFDCKYVESVSAHHLQNLELIDVAPTRVGYIMSVNPEDVLSFIRKKERKLIDYRNLASNDSIEEYWLFLSVPGDTFQDLEDFVMPPFETNFDSVFINRFSSVLRLK